MKGNISSTSDASRQRGLLQLGAARTPLKGTTPSGAPPCRDKDGAVRTPLRTIQVPASTQCAQIVEKKTLKSTPNKTPKKTPTRFAPPYALFLRISRPKAPLGIAGAPKNSTASHLIKDEHQHSCTCMCLRACPAGVAGRRRSGSRASRASRVCS